MCAFILFYFLCFLSFNASFLVIYSSCALVNVHFKFNWKVILLSRSSWISVKWNKKSLLCGKSTYWHFKKKFKGCYWWFSETKTASEKLLSSKTKRNGHIKGRPLLWGSGLWRAALRGALLAAVALVGHEGFVDGEVFDVGLQDVHHVGLAGNHDELGGEKVVSLINSFEASAVFRRRTFFLLLM